MGAAQSMCECVSGAGRISTPQLWWERHSGCNPPSTEHRILVSVPWVGVGGCAGATRLCGSGIGGRHAPSHHEQAVHRAGRRQRGNRLHRRRSLRIVLPCRARHEAARLHDADVEADRVEQGIHHRGGAAVEGLAPGQERGVLRRAVEGARDAPAVRGGVGAADDVQEGLDGGVGGCARGKKRGCREGVRP